MTHNPLPHHVKAREKKMSLKQIILTSRESISEVTEENIDYDIDASATTFLINMINQIPKTLESLKNIEAPLVLT